MRDTEGRFLLADESFRRLAARDPTGLRADQIFSADVAAMLTRDDARILADGVTVETEETIPTASGPRVFLSVKFPMRDADDHVIGLCGIQTDISSLKRAEADARESVTRRDHFLATLSHELRNPLAAILNASRAITRGGSPAEESGELQTLITERALHMTHLVDDLLDVARLTQDKLVLERERMDLRTTAHGVIDEVSAIFKERSISLVTSIDDVELPVLGDPTRLHQLQVNLLANAARYTPPGGEAFYTIRRVDDFAEIGVTDRGEGIAPDMLERIFDLFVQAGPPGARGRDGGLGVGLALVRRIVELHSGSVSVASPGLGKGTEFRVRIPLTTQDTYTASIATSLGGGKVATSFVERRPATVLLVDDDAASRLAMCKLLELDDIAVALAIDGAEALDYLATKAPPDLVLLDIGLPGMDGYEVCRRMRLLPNRGAPCVVALTGFGQESDRAAAAQAGFDAHLTKPVDVDDIYAEYARQFARRQAAG
jgi:signal transduction histidine kinase/ActR/RegA family two-component response regulator